MENEFLQFGSPLDTEDMPMVDTGEFSEFAEFGTPLSPQEIASTSQKPGFLERAGQRIAQRGQTMSGLLATPTGLTGKSAITTGIQATAQPFGAIGDVVMEGVKTLPGGETALGALGGAIGAGVKGAARFISPVSEAIVRLEKTHPQVAKVITEALDSAVASGEIAGNILLAEGVSKGLQKGVDVGQKALSDTKKFIGEEYTSAKGYIGQKAEVLKNKITGNKPLTPELEKKLMSANVPDARLATKMVDESGNVVPDKLASEVVKQGVSKQDVALIKSASSADKLQMKKMLEIREAQLVNKRLTARSTDIVGDTFIEKVVKPIDKLNKEAAQELNIVAEGLKGQRGNPLTAIEKLKTDLNSAGVKISGKNLDFKGSDFEGLKSVQKSLQDIWNRGTNITKTSDAYDMHRIKTYIDNIVDYGKQTEGLTGYAEKIIKGFRRNIDTSLDDSFELYKTVNTQFADTIKPLNNLGAVIGKKFKIYDKFVDAQAGTGLRRILSNTQSRAEQLKLIDDLQGVAKKYGVAINEDVITQANFADVLEKLMGSEAPTSFLGQGERFISAGTELARGNLIKATVKGVGAVADITRGVNINAGVKALKDLLNKSSLPANFNSPVVGKTTSIPPITLRPPHQAAIEIAANKGDWTAVKKIIEKIPLEDPYRQSMESLFANKIKNL